MRKFIVLLVASFIVFTAGCGRETEAQKLKKENDKEQEAVDQLTRKNQIANDRKNAITGHSNQKRLEDRITALEQSLDAKIDQKVNVAAEKMKKDLISKEGWDKVVKEHNAKMAKIQETLNGLMAKTDEKKGEASASIDLEEEIVRIQVLGDNEVAKIIVDAKKREGDLWREWKVLRSEASTERYPKERELLLERADQKKMEIMRLPTKTEGEIRISKTRTANRINDVIKGKK